MAEELVLQTGLDVTIISNNIAIRSFYTGEVININTISAFIADIIETIDGIEFIEGELGIEMINYPSKIDYIVDDNGDLIISAEDAERYSIDGNGDLIFT